MTEVLEQLPPTAESYKPVYSGLMDVEQGAFSSVQGNIYSGVIRLKRDGETERWEQVVPVNFTNRQIVAQDTQIETEMQQRYEQGRLALAVSGGLSEFPNPSTLDHMSREAKLLRISSAGQPELETIYAHAIGIQQEITALRQSTAAREVNKLNTLTKSHDLLVHIESIYSSSMWDRKLARLAGFALKGNAEEGFGLVTLIRGGSETVGLVPRGYRTQGLYRKTKYRNAGVGR